MLLLVRGECEPKASEMGESPRLEFAAAGGERAYGWPLLLAVAGRGPSLVEAEPVWTEEAERLRPWETAGLGERLGLKPVASDWMRWGVLGRGDWGRGVLLPGRGSEGRPYGAHEDGWAETGVCPGGGGRGWEV